MAGSPFIDSVFRTVSSELSRGPGVVEIARALNLSARTFQRRLSQMGLTYSRLLDELRFDEARQMLSDPNLPIGQIAATLGYTDAGSFTRAFQRWASISPRSYRRRCLARTDEPPTDH